MSVSILFILNPAHRQFFFYKNGNHKVHIRIDSRLNKIPHHYFSFENSLSFILSEYKQKHGEREREKKLQRNEKWAFFLLFICSKCQHLFIKKRVHRFLRRFNNFVKPTEKKPFLYFSFSVHCIHLLLFCCSFSLFEKELVGATKSTDNIRVKRMCTGTIYLFLSLFLTCSLECLALEGSERCWTAFVCQDELVTNFYSFFCK